MKEFDFNEQRKIGQKYEKHFFDYLSERGQYPKYNNFGGKNTDYDIEANGKRYEVKADLKDNNNLPIEIVHAELEGMNIKIKCGWLLQTKADYIVFYKPSTLTRFYLHHDSLYKFVSKTMLEKQFKSTRNKSMLTGNFLYTIDELNEAEVIKKIEHYLE